MGDVVAEGVGGVGAGAVGFVDVGGGGAGSVGLPGDLFEIFDEFAAAGIDVEADVVGMSAEAAVDAINAVADGRIDGGGANGDAEFAFPVSEEVADDDPIGSGGGGAFLMAAGVAVDVNLQGSVAPRDLVI